MTRALLPLSRLARALRPRAILLDALSEGVDEVVRELADSSVVEQIPILVFSRSTEGSILGTLQQATDADLVGYVEGQRAPR